MLAFLVSSCSSGQDSAGDGDVGVAESAAVAVEDSASTTSTTSTTTTVAPEPQVAVDYGVTESVIRIGYSLDLSGPFASHDAHVLDGHQAYFDAVNAEGGIEGRVVELVRLDSGFDVPMHLDNIAELIEESDAGVVAIGGLSHPNFDDATVEAVGDAGLLIVGNTPAGVPAAGATAVVPTLPSVCVQTAVGVAALIGEQDASSVSVAFVGRDEPWATASRETVESLAELLGFSIDVTVVGFDDLSDVTSELAESEVGAVWAAVSPRELGTLAFAFEEDQRDWRWSGPSVAFDASLLETESAAEVARVYQHVSAVAPIDDASQAEARQALAEAFPDLTYSAASPAALGYTQAELVHEVLVEAFAQGDVTRANVARLGEELAPDIGAPEVYGLERSVQIGEPLAVDEGGSGLSELDIPFDTAAALQVCQ